MDVKGHIFHRDTPIWKLSTDTITNPSDDDADKQTKRACAVAAVVIQGGCFIFLVHFIIYSFAFFIIICKRYLKMDQKSSIDFFLVYFKFTHNDFDLYFSCVVTFFILNKD